jgi:acyl-CoA dehydrogenase
LEDGQHVRTTPFTEEHEQLRASVRAWVEDELVPNVPAWEEAGMFPDDVFRRAGELGLLGLSVPVEDGGQGGDHWATVVFLEEVARASGSIGMALAVQTDMATPPIRQFGTPEQKAAYLAPALRGERIAAVGISEPDAGSDVAATRTRAERDGDGWVLNGSKTYITNGARADFVTMVVRTSPAPSERGRQAPDEDPWGGLSLFLVDTDLDGFAVSSTLDKVGMRASDTALLYLDDVRVPGDALLGVEGEGFAQVMWELQGERLAAACLAVGGAAANVERAFAYAREREAFGRPIAQFQAVKHRLVDIATDVEQVRWMVYEACDRWNRGEYATTQVAMAKLAAAQMSFRVADEVMQVFGGYGYSEEFPVERAWRDARLGRIGGGTDEVQREIISRLMGV